MRLIDADDLILTILAHDLCDTEQVDKDILEAPTVEAIPIDWINKYVEHMTNIFGPMDIMTMLRKYKQGFIPSVPEKEPIENWEEANETN